MSLQRVPDEFDAHVLRIVGPLHALSRRKRAMRDELLAHLLEAYEQELDRTDGGDERAAIDRALERLGSPDLLGPQLQASVPLVERLLSRCFSRKETAMSRVLSIVGLLAIVAGVFTAIVLVFPHYGPFINVGMVAVAAAWLLARLVLKDERLTRRFDAKVVVLVGIAGVLVGTSVILPALAKTKQQGGIMTVEAIVALAIGIVLVLEGFAYVACSLSLRRPPVTEG